MDIYVLIITIVTVAFGILQIILFFKLWGMTNDIREIKDKYMENNHLEQNNPNQSNLKLTIGMSVINRYTRKKMIIKSITNDGKYCCYADDGEYEGDFVSTALENENISK